MIMPKPFRPTAVSGNKIIVAGQLDEHFDLVLVFELRIEGIVTPIRDSDKVHERKSAGTVNSYVEELLEKSHCVIKIDRPVTPQLKPIPAFWGDISVGTDDSLFLLSDHLLENRFARSDVSHDYRWSVTDSEELTASFLAGEVDPEIREKNLEDSYRLDIPDLPEDW